MFLFNALVVAFPGHPQSQQIAVEGEAPIGIPHHDGGVIDAEEEGLPVLPARVALIGRELQNLERMAVRITEVEGSNPRRAGNALGQKLR